MQKNEIHAIGQDYPILQRYLGELRFAACLRVCAALKISWKQVADSLPDQLAIHFDAKPELAELALLERSMRKAFEAFEPETRSTHKVHPSVSLVTLFHNSASLWSALVCEEPPPTPYALAKPQPVVIWRNKGGARMRLLGDEEYRCIAALLATREKSQIKTQPATQLYVAGWLESELMLAAPA